MPKDAQIARPGTQEQAKQSPYALKASPTSVSNTTTTTKTTVAIAASTSPTTITTTTTWAAKTPISQKEEVKVSDNSSHIAEQKKKEQEVKETGWIGAEIRREMREKEAARLAQIRPTASPTSSSSSSSSNSGSAPSSPSVSTNSTPRLEFLRSQPSPQSIAQQPSQAPGFASGSNNAAWVLSSSPNSKTPSSPFLLSKSTPNIKALNQPSPLLHRYAADDNKAQSSQTPVELRKARFGNRKELCQSDYDEYGFFSFRSGSVLVKDETDEEKRRAVVVLGSPSSGTFDLFVWQVSHNE